jgi:hypothetical protein
MKDFAKIIFIVVGGIFFISYVQDAGLGNSGGFDFSKSNATYSPSPASYARTYDTNGDGTIDAQEYQQGEVDRIAREVSGLEQLVAKAQQEQNRSPYYGKITLRNGNTRTEDVHDEYITLQASGNNTGPIIISGWVLKSLVSDKAVAISRGVPVLDASRPWLGEKDAYLLPGEKAIVNTGYAIGINTGFMENKCTGYLDDRYDLSPSIRRDCPQLEDESLVTQLFPPQSFDDLDNYDACINAIERVPQCSKPSSALHGDSELAACREFITKYATYDGCVLLHKTDVDFLTGPWRLFLEVRKEMWRKEREAIELLDLNGKVVDVLEYH